MIEQVSPAPLRGLNTFGVAATARRLLRLGHESQLPALPGLLAGERPLVLGGGSNLLITSEHVDRTLLQPALPGLTELAHEGDTVVVEAGAGVPWHTLVRETLARGLCGLENLAFIPGSTGASPVQNIGAYGLEMRERFHSLRALHLGRFETRVFGPTDCRFGYRDSVFKHEDGEGWMVLAVRFALSRRSAPRTGYADLQAELDARGVRLAGDGRPEDALRVAEAVEAVRRRKLPDPAMLGNAGSFFKNPVVPAAQASALAAAHPGLPVWPSADGQAKLSAAWLIDRAGWKDRRRGDAGVHAHHALVLVNHGAATGADLRTLAADIAADVHARFGVALEPEPVFV